jgi:hypothetical protein
MDVLFQIFLPELKPVARLEPHQDTFWWEGEEHPQGPVVYRWGTHVQLVPRGIQEHVPRFLPEGYLGPDWVFFDVEGDGLELLWEEVRGREVDWGGRRLDDLLSRLLEQHDRWVVLFEPFSDQIDNVYRLLVQECLDKLKANLARDTGSEGFIALPPEAGH